jgi:hypothetical protein
VVPPAAPEFLHRCPQRIGAWLAGRGIAYLDLLPVLRAVEPCPDGDRHCYLLRDTHFNVRGNAAAAPAMASLMRALLRR